MRRHASHLGSLKVRAVVTAVALVAASCSSDDEGSDSTTGPSATATQSPSGDTTASTSGQEQETTVASSTPDRPGGSIVVGIEQWPECVNPVTCGSTSAVQWSVLEHVLPRAMVPDASGDYVATPLLVEAPSTENGGVTTDPFAVTYTINPNANWSDGTAITSADFDFTWRAIMSTEAAYSRAGYTEIESIDTTDPKVAVVHFSAPYVSWPELFGGTGWGLLEAAAFPDLADSDAPDVSSLMQDEIPFSGGPWILDSWSPEQAILVANTGYFGTVPSFDQMTIIPFDNTNTEIQALLAGQVDVIQPQVGNASVVDQVDRDGIDFRAGNGLLYEAIWINHSVAPLDDPKVREALMYAIDRQSVIDAVVKINNPDATINNCGLVAFPGVGPWCDNVQPFAQFTYDPAKSVEILESAGYDCSAVPDEPCSKDGTPLVLEYSTTSEDTRRTTSQQLLQDKLTGTGFEFTINNYPAGVLFSDILPSGNFQLTTYARGSYDPSVTGYLGCDGIPTEANGFVGGNWNHWCNSDADALMKQSDSELDSAKRQGLMDQVYEMEGADFVSLPLYILPEIAAWRSDKVAGIGDYVGNLLGVFYDANEWTPVG